MLNKNKFNLFKFLINLTWLLKFLFRNFSFVIYSVIFISLFSLVIAFLEYKTIVLITTLLDNLNSDYFINQKNDIYSVIFISVIVFFSKYFSSFFQNIQLSKLRAKLSIKYLRNQISRFQSLEILNKESDYYISTEYFPGLITYDLLNPLLQFLNSLIISVGVIFALFKQDEILLFFVAPVIIIIYVFHATINSKLYTSLSELNYSLRQKVKDIDSSYINNFRMILSDCSEEKFIEYRLKDELRLLYNEAKISTIRNSSRFLVDTIFAIVISIFLLIASISSNSFSFLPVLFLTAIKLIPLLQQTNFLISNSLANYAPLLDATKRLKEIDIKRNSKPRVSFKKFKNRISIKNGEISIADKVIISEINFQAQSKDKILLTGISGSGKSLFLGVLSGVYSLKKGNLFFDEKNIGINSDIRFLSKEIPQFPVIPDVQSIRNYLTENTNDNDDSKMKNLLSYFNLEKIISRLDSPAGSMQSNLSGGMLQRLAIIRAILSPPKPIILLDECTSALDKRNRDLAISKIIDSFSDSIVIFSTHEDLEKSLFTRHYSIKDKKLIEQVLDK